MEDHTDLKQDISKLESTILDLESKTSELESTIHNLQETVDKLTMDNYRNCRTIFDLAYSICNYDLTSLKIRHKTIVNALFEARISFLSKHELKLVFTEDPEFLAVQFFLDYEKPKKRKSSNSSERLQYLKVEFTKLLEENPIIESDSFIERWDDLTYQSRFCIHAYLLNEHLIREWEYSKEFCRFLPY